MTKTRWQDWTNALLGLWLFVSPWYLPHHMVGAGRVGDFAMWNLWVVGTLVFVFALMALTGFRVWKEWLVAALGTWLFLSPWFFGIERAPALTWNATLGGLVVVALAGWVLGYEHNVLPKRGRAKGDLRGDQPGLAFPDEHEHLAGLGPHRVDEGPDIEAPDFHVQAPGQATKG